MSIILIIWEHFYSWAFFPSNLSHYSHFMWIVFPINAELLPKVPTEYYPLQNILLLSCAHISHDISSWLIWYLYSTAFYHWSTYTMHMSMSVHLKQLKNSFDSQSNPTKEIVSSPHLIMIKKMRFKFVCYKVQHR